MSHCLFICLPVYGFLYLSLSMSLCMLSLCMSLCLCVCISVSVYVSLSLCLYLSLSLYMSLSLYISLCLCVCLFVFVSVSKSMRLCLSFSSVTDSEHVVVRSSSKWPTDRRRNSFHLLTSTCLVCIFSSRFNPTLDVQVLRSLLNTYCNGLDVGQYMYHLQYM